jgi:hypothetical protein
VELLIVPSLCGKPMVNAARTGDAAPHAIETNKPNAAQLEVRVIPINSTPAFP